MINVLPEILLVFFTSLGAGLLSFVIPSGKLLQKKFLLAFSGSFLLGITVLNLLPEVYSESTKNTGLFILAGFLVQVLMEYFSEGIEHGHQHLHRHHSHQYHDHSAIPFGLMIGLCLHAFLEGFPLLKYNFEEDNWGIQHSLMVGIIVHNFPVAITLVQVLYECGLKKEKVIQMLLLFAFCTPIGIISGILIQSSNVIENLNLHGYILSFVIGIFLHVSLTILLESSESHKINAQKLFVILLGFGIAFLFS